MITQKIQRCVACGEPTGRCEEDSIYLPPKDPNGSDLGPLCEACCDEREACIRIIEDTVRAVDGMDAIAAIRARGQERDALKADAEKHYAAGWIAAAKWAERDDLISDIDSPAYIADRDAAIDNARSKE